MHAVCFRGYYFKIAASMIVDIMGLKCRDSTMFHVKHQKSRQIKEKIQHIVQIISSCNQKQHYIEIIVKTLKLL